jgi:hypothetical protein
LIKLKDESHQYIKLRTIVGEGVWD